MTIRDRDTLGALAGIGGILARDIWSFFAKQVGLAKFYIWQNAAGLFMQKAQIETILGTISGLLADAVMGALIGVFFIRFLKMGQDRNPVLKGWGFGLGLWLLLFGILMHSLPSGIHVAPRDAKSVLSAFIGHSIFGLVLGLLTSLLLRATDTGVGHEGK